MVSSAVLFDFSLLRFVSVIYFSSVYSVNLKENLHVYLWLQLDFDFVSPAQSLSRFNLGNWNIKLIVYA